MRFIFDENILDKNIVDTKETLEYLRSKKHELVAVSSKSEEEQIKWLEENNLLLYFDLLIPGINIKDVNRLFFLNLQRVGKLSVSDNGMILREKLRLQTIPNYEAVLPNKECALISASLIASEEARKEGWQSIFYDDGSKNVVGGKKIKRLETLKVIY